MSRDRTSFHVELLDAVRLRFDDGEGVRAASAVAPLGDGWLVAQDDSVDAAWWRAGGGRADRVRLLPAREGPETFDEASGTKRLKPDLEAGCGVEMPDGPAVLMLGSGSLPPRTAGVLVRDTSDGPQSRSVDLAPLYDRVRTALGLAEAELNLEGACVVGDRLRWFQRGHGASGVMSASVDIDLRQLLRTMDHGDDPARVPVGAPRRYDLGDVDGLPLAITDAVTLPDGRLLVSATAEDAPDAIADGPVTGSALALLGDDGDDHVVVALPGELATCKVEGLAVVASTQNETTLLVVVDEDDPTTPSLAAHLAITWTAGPPAE